MTLSSMLFYAILSIDFFFTRIPHISKSPSGLTKPVNSRFLIFSSYIDNVNIYVLFHSSRCYFIQTILEYFSCSSNNHNGVGNISKFIQDSCSSSSFPLQGSVSTCFLVLQVTFTVKFPLISEFNVSIGTVSSMLNFSNSSLAVCDSVTILTVFFA